MKIQFVHSINCRYDYSMIRANDFPFLAQNASRCERNAKSRREFSQFEMKRAKLTIERAFEVHDWCCFSGNRRFQTNFSTSEMYSNSNPHSTANFD